MNSKEIQEGVSRPDIDFELQKMVDIDQEMRERAHKEDDFWDGDIDRRNTQRIKEIIKEIGFPFISIVGQEGAHNAWLLVQHADNDVNFQVKCLGLMKQAPVGEVAVVDIAYLEDRIRINHKQPQLYGTQFTQEGGKHLPIPIEDEKMVNERRARMGMGTLDDQIKSMYEKYPKP